MSECYTAEIYIKYFTAFQFRAALDYMQTEGHIDAAGKVVKEDGIPGGGANAERNSIELPRGYYRNLGRIALKGGQLTAGMRNGEICWTTTDGQFSGYYYRKGENGSFVEVYEEDLWQWSLSSGTGIKEPDDSDAAYEAQSAIEKAWFNYHVS